MQGVAGQLAEPAYRPTTFELLLNCLSGAHRQRALITVHATVLHLFRKKTAERPSVAARLLEAFTPLQSSQA